MAVSGQSLALVGKAESRSRFTITLAHTEAEVRQCQALRYEVFAGEMGAELAGDTGLDCDHFDAFCKHLLVRDEETGKVVGTTRVLLDHDAIEAGSFYSQTEFDLTHVMALSGRFMEIGRTCIHAEYRSGAALGLLWQGILSLMKLHNVDYLIGCASIPFGDTGRYAVSVVEYLKRKNEAPEYLRVYPKVSLPKNEVSATVDVVVPPLLKAYIRLGAMICGEAYWDMSFNCADVFMLLDCDRLNTRYLNRVLAR